MARAASSATGAADAALNDVGVGHAATDGQVEDRQVIDVVDGASLGVAAVTAVGADAVPGRGAPRPPAPPWASVPVIAVSETIMYASSP